MRRTLNLDEDVAVAIERLRRTRCQSLKSLINEALRIGLQRMTARPQKRRPFHTKSARLGRCLAGNVDNIAEVFGVDEAESSN